jgi:hypothetical protein
MNTTAVLVAAVAVLIPACSGPGTDADTQFVAALNSQGIPGDRGVEIKGAHQACDALRRIADADIRTNKNPPMSLILESGQKIKDVHDRLTGQGLSLDQYEQFMVAADNTLCPDVKDAWNRLEQTP